MILTSFLKVTKNLKLNIPNRKSEIIHPKLGEKTEIKPGLNLN